MKRLLLILLFASLSAGAVRAQGEAVVKPTGPGVEDAARMYREIWAEHGLEIVAMESYGNKDKDMTPQLTRIRSTNAQATVIWGTGGGLAIAIKNFRQLGIKHPLYISHAGNDFNVMRLAGPGSDGVLLPHPAAKARPAPAPSIPIASRRVSVERSCGRLLMSPPHAEVPRSGTASLRF